MVRIFTDFDGTITRGDVGDALFERFGGREAVEAVSAYRSGELSAVECFRAECTACGDVRADALEEFIGEQTIDPEFPGFVSWCRLRGFPLMILSDGMDVYIRGILERHGLGDVEFRANRLDLPPAAGAAGSVRFAPSFPNTDEICDRCASCKRNEMLTRSADEDVIVYVGEGYSDRCPARYADMVFAKDELLVWCRENSVPCYEYASFGDVSRRIDRMTGPGAAGSGGGASRLPRRARAAVARRDIYLGG